MNNSLQSLIQAVLDARASLSDPPDNVRQAREQLREAERILAQHRQAPEQAVAAYNEARRRMFIGWAKEKGLGYCSKGKHLAPLDSIEGVITTGAYVTSGYYEYLRDYEVRHTICPGCRHMLRGGGGRYDGEFTHHATHELKDPVKSLEAVPLGYELDRLAAEHQVEIPAEMRYDGRLPLTPTITLGKKEL